MCFLFLGDEFSATALLSEETRIKNTYTDGIKFYAFIIRDGAQFQNSERKKNPPRSYKPKRIFTISIAVYMPNYALISFSSAFSAASC